MTRSFLMAGVSASALVFASPALATAYFVSNSATNGYALGVDANSGLSVSAPFLTIAKCTSVTAAADVCTINPSATPYSENSASSGYLAFGSGATVQGDPTQCALGSTPTIRAASYSGWVVNVPSASTAQTLACVTIDPQLGASRQGVKVNASQALTLSRVAFINGNSSLISDFTGAWNLTLDRINVDSSNTYSGTTLFGFYATSQNGTLVFTGGTLAAPNVSTGQLLFQTTHISTVAFNKAVDGSRLTFFGPAAYQLRVNAAASIASMTGYVGFNATTSGVFFYQGTVSSYALTISSQNMTTGRPFSGSGFTSSSGSITFDSFIGNYPAVYINSEFASNQHINYGNFSITAGGNPGYFIQVSGGSGFQVNNNAFTLASGDSLGTFISFGPDGITPEASNSSAATATQAIGDTSNNSIACQSWTAKAASSNSHFPNAAAAFFYLKKTGSPAGTLTAQLYSDSAGAPGTLLATSTTTLAASALTTSSALYEFAWNPPPAITGAATYHACLAYAGTNDGTNYVLADTNATTTEGSIHTAPTSSGAWTADAAHALLNQVYTSVYQTVSPQANDNRFTLLGTGDGATEMQGIQLGSSYNPQALRNFFQVLGVGGGVGYGILAKNTYGNSTLISGNGIIVGGGVYGGIYDKAAYGTVTATHNTIVVNGTASGATGVLIGPDSLNEVNTINPAPMVSANNAIVTTSGNFPYGVLTGSSVSADYDDLYAAGAVYEKTTGANWATWRASGQEANGINVSPNLTNQSAPTVMASLYPLAGSPLFNAGSGTFPTTPYDGYGNLFSSVNPTIGAFSVMSGVTNLLARVSAAAAVYAIVRDNTGAPWNTATGATESYASANYSKYVVGMSQEGASGVWVGSMPGFPTAGSPPAGAYTIDYRVMTGSSPAEGDTIIASGKMTINWSGSAELGPVYSEGLVQ